MGQNPSCFRLLAHRPKSANLLLIVYNPRARKRDAYAALFGLASSPKNPRPPSFFGWPDRSQAPAKAKRRPSAEIRAREPGTFAAEAGAPQERPSAAIHAREPGTLAEAEGSGHRPPASLASRASQGPVTLAASVGSLKGKPYGPCSAFFRSERLREPEKNGLFF